MAAQEEVDQGGHSALQYAALDNDVEKVAGLLSDGANPSRPDYHGYTPLHFAAQEGSLDAARLLVDAGAEVDAADQYGNTPLWTAVFNSRGQGEMIALLRSNGADPHHRNNSGATPVELARGIGNYDVARYFAGLPL